MTAVTGSLGNPLLKATMFLSTHHLQQIADHQPQERSEFSLLQAAVAIILRDTPEGTEFLLMQRAKHEQDPWSGQMSFPGGKIDPEDATAKDAAIREVSEEVGIELSEQDYVGRLDDLYGLKVDDKYSVHVSCFIFKPERSLAPVGNHEVADLVWLPFAWLHDQSNSHDYIHPHSKNKSMPAVMIDSDKEQIFWGLSLRMIAMLHELLGLELKVLGEDRENELKRIEEHNMDSKDLDGITQRVFNREAS